MRIGIDVTGLGAAQRFTGMGEYAFQLITHLAPLIPDDEIVLIGYAEDELPEFGANCTRHFLPPRRLGKLSAILSHQVHLPLLSRRAQLDLLHIPWVHVRPSLPAVPWYTRCPLAVTLHDVIPLTFYASNGNLPRRLERFYRLNLRLASRVRRVITVSQTAAAEIKAQTRIGPEQLRVVPNGIDFAPTRHEPQEAAQIRRRLNLPEDYLLYAGSYEPRKNLRRTLEAYRMVVDAGIESDLVLIVEAESGHAPALLAYADSLNLGSRLHFLHSLAQEDLRFIYTHARLFLFPSLAEGFGFPPLQAMQVGVPVIASDRTSLSEVLADAALFIDPEDSRQIADSIRCLLVDKALASRLVSAGKARAAIFTWQRAAAATLAVYREAMNS